jgi:hypothetical protein
MCNPLHARVFDGSFRKFCPPVCYQNLPPCNNLLKTSTQVIFHLCTTMADNNKRLHELDSSEPIQYDPAPPYSPAIGSGLQYPSSVPFVTSSHAPESSGDRADAVELPAVSVPFVRPMSTAMENASSTGVESKGMGV